MALIQKPRSVYCDSPIEACHKFHMASFPTNDASSTVQSVAQYGQVAWLPAIQPGLANNACEE